MPNVKCRHKSLSSVPGKLALEKRNGLLRAANSTLTNVNFLYKTSYDWSQNERMKAKNSLPTSCLYWQNWALNLTWIIRILSFDCSHHSTRKSLCIQHQWSEYPQHNSASIFAISAPEFQLRSSDELHWATRHMYLTNSTTSRTPVVSWDDTVHKWNNLLSCV